MKRFYTQVATQHDAQQGGFVVTLDDKPIKTPLKTLLLSPSQLLAEAIATEWEEQENDISPNDMPLTQILSTCIDRVAGREEEIKAEALSYFETDLLYFRADTPDELVTHQEQLWNPWTKWGEETFGPLPQPTQSLLVPVMPAQTKENMRGYLDALSTEQLTVHNLVTGMAGSCIMACAFIQGKIDTENLLRIMHCEEDFFEEFHDLKKHGKDPEKERKDKALEKDLKACSEFVALIANP